MNPATIAAIIFTCVAIAGSTALVRAKLKGSLPIWLGLLHGMGAAAGLVVLIIAAILGAGLYVLISPALFMLAAVPGILVFSNHIRGKSLPFLFIYVHAALAVTALTLLIIAIAAA